MFIWTAILLDKQLEKLKNKARKIENELNLKPSCHELPSHISLKISFEVADEKFDDVANRITEFYHHLIPFEIECDCIGKEGEIVWLKMRQNELLTCVQYSLNQLLLREFDIPLHAYDCDFKFHSTLFLNDDEQKINKAFALIKNEDFPQKLKASKFVIGISKTGELGSYSVHKEICIE